jgi:hypothetical protein
MYRISKIGTVKKLWESYRFIIKAALWDTVIGVWDIESNVKLSEWYQ